MKITVSIVLIIITSQVFAQSDNKRIKLAAVGGYAFFDHKDLKSINESMAESLPFETTTVDNFDPSFYFGGYVQFKLNKHLDLGPSYEYHYTGSRLGARDYSGMYTFDQYLHVNMIGAKIDYSSYVSGRIVLSYGINTGASFTDWEMISLLEIVGNEYPEKEDYEFKGYGMYISPALRSEFNIISKLFVAAGVSYSFDIIKKYRYKYAKVEMEKTPDWNGFRLFLEIGFYLK